MMSTCPNKDLYSAFVDNEVQSPWREKLETHLQDCKKCNEIVESYRNLKDKLKTSNNPDLDIEESFKRYERKKQFIDIRKETVANTTWFNRTIKIPIPALTAAAIFLFVFMPLIIFSIQRPNEQAQIVVSNFKPIMPVAEALQEKDRQNFNFNELNTLNLKMISNLEREDEQKIDFNSFINLYLPTENTEEDILIFGEPNNNSSFFQNNNVQKYTVNYNNNGK